MVLLRARSKGGGMEGAQVTSDLDIYRAAAILVKDHGEDAPIYAAMRAD